MAIDTVNALAVKNEQEYTRLRNELVELNSNMLGIVLNEDEKKLDRILKKLKDDYIASCEGNVPYDAPALTDPNIWKSGLYDFCSALPKGSDLHVHGAALVPVWKMLEFAEGREDLLIATEGPRKYWLLAAGNETPEDSALSVKEAFDTQKMDRDDVISHLTVAGCREEDNAWEYFEALFPMTKAVVVTPDLIYSYYVFAFRYYLEIGIIHPEIHILLNGTGKDSLSMLRIIRQAYYDVKAEHPELLVSVIGAGMKLMSFGIERAERSLNATLYAREELKDESDPEHVSEFVIGFDLVNEEDASRPLIEYVPLLRETKRKYPDFKFFIHCGESLDAESDNLIDAYLLGAARVGHGMNLFRYPDLLKRYSDSEICLECCTISNRALRYVPDLRLHPGTEYIRRGVTISLCSDDPIYLEHESLTDDFFAVTVAWNLTVAEIKQLCINSVMYSGIDPDQKRTLIRNWRQKWNKFVIDTNLKYNNIIKDREDD